MTVSYLPLSVEARPAPEEMGRRAAAEPLLWQLAENQLSKLFAEKIHKPAGISEPQLSQRTVMMSQGIRQLFLRGGSTSQDGSLPNIFPAM